jgi:hypothetical protein
LAEIISRVNELFEGELTDDDQLVYVNNVIRGKLLESEELTEQAVNNTKAQFAASPTLSKELTDAIIEALAAHTTMSKQATRRTGRCVPWLRPSGTRLPRSIASGRPSAGWGPSSALIHNPPEMSPSS